MNPGKPVSTTALNLCRVLIPSLISFTASSGSVEILKFSLMRLGVLDVVIQDPFSLTSSLHQNTTAQGLYPQRANQKDAGHNILPISSNIQNVKGAADYSEKQSARE